MANRNLTTLVAAVVSIVACNRSTTTTTTQQQQAAGPRIALVLKTLNSPFFIDMQKGAEEAAARLKVQLVVQAAEREVDVDKQMQIIENLIQTGVKALAVTPSGLKEIVPAIA